MSSIYDSIKKGIEEAINDAKGTIRLERHTVKYNIQNNHQTEAPSELTIRMREKE